MSEDSHRDGDETAAARSGTAGIREQSLAVQKPVSGGFVVLYALAYIGTILLFLAPLLVSLSLKVNTLVGTERAPNSLSLVAGIGAFIAMFANPFFGKLSDRTASRLGMRRPWMIIGLLGGSVGILVIALAPSVLVVLVGWCIAQVFFNALLAALIAVLPDQVPSANAAGSRASWASAYRSPQSAAPTSSSSSPAMPWRCSWPPARLAGS